MPWSSTLARRHLGGHSAREIARARLTVPRRHCRVHGRRLRFGLEAVTERSAITDLWLAEDGSLEEAVCGWCFRPDPRGPVCSHALALLSWASEGLAEGAAPAEHPLLHRTPGQLRSRLARNAALDLWEQPAQTLLARWRKARVSRPGTLEAVLGPRGREAAGWSLAERHLLAEALEAELLARRRARKPAPWREAAPPTEAGQALAQALWSERDRRRRHTAPLHVAGTPTGGTFTITADPLEVSWVSRDRRCTTTGGDVRLTLRAGVQGVQIRTHDGQEPVLECPYALDLVNHTLDALSGRGGRKNLAALQASLEAPLWHQSVASLDQVLDGLGIAPTHDSEALPPTATRSGQLLGWQARHDARRGWSLRAVWTTPYVRRSGLRVDEVHAHDLHHRTQQLGRQDRAVLRAAGSAFQAHRCIQPEAFAAVVGHPRLVDEGRELLALRTGQLGLCLAPAEEGGLQVSFRDETTGRGRTAGEVQALLQQRGEGRVVLDAGQTVTTVFSVDAAQAALAEALCAHEGRLPHGAEASLLARLPALRAVFPVTLDPALQGSEVAPTLRPLVRLAPQASGPIEVQVTVRPLQGGPRFAPGVGPTEVEAVWEGERVSTVRDLGVEQAAVADALGPDAAVLGLDGETVLPLTEGTLAVLHRLQARAQEGHLALEWTRDALRIAGTARLVHLQVAVGGGRDWLGLGGALRIDGHTVELDRVLEAVRSGRRYLRVDASSFVALDEALRSRLARLSQRVRTDARGRTHLAPLSGPVLAALAEQGAQVEVPEAVQFETDRLREAEARAWAVPAGLEATLRPYQAHGLAWLQRLAHWAPGACLADDMGLGKTLQALGLLVHRQAGGPALVVAPTSLGANWLAEASRFAPGLEVALYRGSQRSRMLERLGPGRVLVTSYDLLRRDADALAKAGFHTVVYDEAQALKNPASQTARRAATVRGDFCLALSGTPVENRTEELWSLFRVLVPGLLGSLAGFRRSLGARADGGSADAQGEVASLVGPFLLRRTKAEVATDLPARTELIHRVELSPAERRLYDAARLEGMKLREQAPAQARFAVLKALTRLRQLACDPRLVDPSTRATSSKLAALADLVGSAVGQGAQVLVFSQFTGLLDHAERALSAHRHLRLDGSTPVAERARRVRAFQAGEADVFFLSRTAAGTGLNLTAATYVFHLDPWWNPAAEDQATDRAHRIGQDKPVTVYRLIAANTVEEGVLQMQSAKRDLVDGILSGAKAAGTVSVDALVALLQGEAAA